MGLVEGRMCRGDCRVREGEDGNPVVFPPAE